MVAKKSRKAEKVAEENPKETAIEFLASLAGVLVTALFILTFVVQSFAIPSSSKGNTLLVGDHVFVNRGGFAPRSLWVGSLVAYWTFIVATLWCSYRRGPRTLPCQANHRDPRGPHPFAPGRGLS